MLPKTLTALQHPFVKYLTKLRKDSAFRREEKKILVTGRTLVVELFTGSEKIVQTILMKKSTPLPPELSRAEILFVSPEILKKITGLPQPDSFAAIISLPTFKYPKKTTRLLVLDGISDPGNLGTLLRTALALGWDGAYLVRGTCDPFNDKALRSAKGATFRLPIQEGSWEEFLSLQKELSLQILTADAGGVPLQKTSPAPPLALILSRESQGARKEALSLGTTVSIPMDGPMESLNVAAAGAILLYRLKELS